MPRVDRYELLDLLGEGSFGAVYRARHVHTGQLVALKVARGVVDPEAAARILAEGRAAARLRHPNVVSVLDSGIAEHGETFVVMELLEGVTLEQLLERAGGRLPLARTLAFAAQLLDALDAAHRAGVIHRDVKPSNLFVLPGDVVKVIDFGISKLGPSDVTGALVLTLPGVAMGTPGYMAPEQLGDARSVDVRADIYAVGATIYRCLAGRKPIDAEGFEAWMRKLREEPAPLLASLVPAVPPAIADVVDRSLARDRDARWPSASAFRTALREAETHGASMHAATLAVTDIPSGSMRPSVPASPTTSSSRARDPWRFALGGMLFAVLALVALAVAVAWRQSR